MPRYFFDLDDNGELHPDEQGMECRGFAVAKQEAIRALVEMTEDVLPNGDRRLLKIQVRNEAGDLLLQVAMNFEVEVERSPDAEG